jgi:hypothetical protein
LSPRLLAPLLLAAATATSQAQTLASTQTYSNIAFSLTPAPPNYSACNELRIDASGDFASSTKFVVFGVLNCPTTATGYTLAGSGYFGFNGSLNMSFFMSNGLWMQCPTLVNLAGTCTFHNGAGVQVGSTAIALK